MSVWRWIDRRTLILLHDESLAEHGGASGLRDETMLQSSLARPLHLVSYGSPDVADLAAAKGVGLAKNNPFVAGNKRAAFLSVGLFLALNGQRLVAMQAEATLVMFDAAASAMNESSFASWIRAHMAPRSA